MVPDYGPQPIALAGGEPSPHVPTQKSGSYGVGSESALEDLSLTAKERLRGPAAGFGGVFDLGRCQIRRQGSRREQSRGKKKRSPRLTSQAAIGSSRSTRGESDSAPRSVQRMSSSMRTPNRPGR